MLRRVLQEVDEDLFDQEFVNRDQRKVVRKSGVDRVELEPVLNETALAVETRLRWLGKTMVTLPIRVREAA